MTTNDGPHVLVVDDDEVHLFLTSAALTHRGFTVDASNCGDDVVRHALARRYDLIVLDAVMPGLDGFELCRLIRANAELRSMPLLMLSGLDDEASMARARAAGATDYLVKSGDWSALAARLADMLLRVRATRDLETRDPTLHRAHLLDGVGRFDLASAPWRIRLSTGAGRVLGLDARREPSLREVLRTIAPDGRARLVEALRGRRGRGMVWSFELRLAGRIGGGRRVRVECEADVDTGSGPRGCTGFVQDISG